MSKNHSLEHLKAVGEHSIKLDKIGEEWYPYLEALAEHSNVPIEFDALFRHRILKNLEQRTLIDTIQKNWRDTASRLVGLDFPNEVSARHAMSYGQAVSVIKILEGKNNPDDSLLKVLSCYKFEPDRAFAVKACYHFASDIVGFDTVIVNPNISQRAKKKINLLTLRLKGDFDSNEIITSVEEQFSKISLTKRAQADFTLLLSREGSL